MATDTSTTNETLGEIDSKLSALLAIVLDSYLRDTGVARPKPRSIDRLLTDAGLSPQAIGALLGKTDRAVNLALQREREEAERKTGGSKRNGKRA